MTDSNGRTRWCQFTLRQLFIVLALCSAVLAFRASNPREMVPCRTGRALDLAILGRGYFQTIDPVTGTCKYTRNGHVSLNANGDVVFGWLYDGFLLQPQITVPQDWTQVVVGRDGLFSIQHAGAGSLWALGKVHLALFMNDEGLREAEPGLYEETEASGSAMLVGPGANGAGVVLQGWLTGSPGWSTLLADAHLHLWLFAAMASMLAWLAIEVRRQRRVLAEVLARWTDCRVAKN